jgi:cytochrome c556
MNKIFIACLIFIILSNETLAEKNKVFQRAKPPVFRNEDSQSKTFFKDAFDELGERPESFLVAKESDIKLQPQPPKVVVEFDRSGHMKQIARSEDGISEILSSKIIFSKQINHLDKHIESLMLIINKLKQSDPMFEEDEDYQKHIQQFYKLAQTMKEDSQNNNYEKTKFSFSKLKQQCDSCHSQFR